MFQEFLTPTSVAEAVRLRKTLPSATYLAGGTELNSTVWPCRPVDRKSTAISLARLPLAGLEVADTGVRIGACVTIQTLADRSDLPPALAAAVRLFANRNVRTMGTIGGNIGGNGPCTNIGPALLALDARIVLASGSGGRTVPLADHLANQD
ncbi:MAG: FAD binding domain-containing protein, partial [Candidatus Riflebacteria bacterium]|nr:FAD binding domain-containing protein [Candidatus Riflebacteria bacterium]